MLIGKEYQDHTLNVNIVIKQLFNMKTEDLDLSEELINAMRNNLAYTDLETSDYKDAAKDIMELFKEWQKQQSTTPTIQLEEGELDWEQLRNLWQSVTGIDKDKQSILYFDQFLLGYQAAYQQRSSERVFSEAELKKALRVGVNIGIQNVEQPRYEGDFNFNKEKSIEECKQYLLSIK